MIYILAIQCHSEEYEFLFQSGLRVSSSGCCRVFPFTCFTLSLVKALKLNPDFCKSALWQVYCSACHTDEIELDSDPVLVMPILQS